LPGRLAGDLLLEECLKSIQPTQSPHWHCSAAQSWSSADAWSA